MNCRPSSKIRVIVVHCLDSMGPATRKHDFVSMRKIKAQTNLHIFAVLVTPLERVLSKLAASALTNDHAQISFFTLWVCKQQDYAMYSH